MATLTNEELAGRNAIELLPPYSASDPAPPYSVRVKTNSNEEQPFVINIDLSEHAASSFPSRSRNASGQSAPVSLVSRTARCKRVLKSCKFWFYLLITLKVIAVIVAIVVISQGKGGLNGSG